MSINYTTYVSQISNLMVIGSTDPNFQVFLPGCIDYAEQRIYRELDLLATQVIDASGATTSSDRNFDLPTTLGTFVVVDNINIITPAGTGSSVGVRVPLTATSLDFIDMVYPSGQVSPGVPQYYSMVDNTSIVFAPPPDNSYFAEVIGTQRPTPLSTGNSSTFLTAYLPDLFMAASMVFASGYMRNFGGQADNPQMSQSWETQYQTLKMSADNEEIRKKYQAGSRTVTAPSAQAARGA